MELAKSNKKNQIIGSSEDVIFIGNHLDIGDISKEVNELDRQCFLNQIINNGELNKSELKQLIDAQLIDA